MSRIALLAALIAAASASACTTNNGTTATTGNTVDSYNAKTENPEDRRFIFGIPQNDR